MELAQTVDTGLPSTQNVTTAFRITPDMIFWSIVIVFAIALVVWAAAKYGNRGYYQGGSYQGTKGGKIKRTITEYEEDERI